MKKQTYKNAFEKSSVTASKRTSILLCVRTVCCFVEKVVYALLVTAWFRKFRTAICVMLKVLSQAKGIITLFLVWKIRLL